MEGTRPANSVTSGTRSAEDVRERPLSTSRAATRPESTGSARVHRPLSAVDLVARGLRVILYNPELPAHTGGSAVFDDAVLVCEDERLADSLRQSLRASGYAVLRTIGVALRASGIGRRGTAPDYC